MNCWFSPIIDGKDGSFNGRVTRGPNVIAHHLSFLRRSSSYHIQSSTWIENQQTWYGIGPWIEYGNYAFRVILTQKRSFLERIWTWDLVIATEHAYNHLIAHPHLLDRATSERFLPTF